MEKNKSSFENPDPWRPAILAERKNRSMEKMLENTLASYEGDRKNALILGDASLVQSHLLLEEQNFKHVVDVDSSPSLMDDDIVPVADLRLERIVSEFDKYEPAADTFDLIYGKSIAFNPKATIEEVLKKISLALTSTGIFYGTYGGEGDSYRHEISYTLQEIKDLYQKANLQIIENFERDKAVSGLLGRQGRAHTFMILAKRRSEEL
jgi:hypothetical protein